MKATVTPEAANAIADIAQRHGLSQEAVLAMLVALRAGGGTMAQFNVPELGGNGQWMRGGMTMVGNMFDNALKARVDALCNELSQLLATTAVFPAPAPSSQAQVGFGANNWWSADLGVPSSVGGQNDVRYAFFPGTRRLAIQINGVTKVFDTGEHHIGGVQQQQGTGYSSVAFTSQFGTFGVSSLHELATQQVAHQPAAEPGAAHQSQYQSGPAPHFPPQAPAPAPPAPEPPPAKPASDDAGNSAAIVAAIESLAGLHQRGILSDEEFSAKKAELLSRL
jgi:Short C-terminal domain